MRAFFVEMLSVAMLVGYLALIGAVISWFTILPSIGFLWTIGWLR